MKRIAIVDPSDSSRESLRALLLGVDFVWLEAECTRYEFFFDVVQQSPPDLVIVSLDADRNKALAMISQLSHEYPTLPILTISSDANALLQSLQRGAKSFLNQPVDLESMLTALKRAFAAGSGINTAGQTGNQPLNTSKGLIISVLGSRGGVGCTSLATNLCATLAMDPSTQVALIDLDLALGDADIALEVPAGDNISLADLARNIERLDMAFLRRAMVKHESGVSILRHPFELTEIDGIHEGHVERILNLLKISYTHLIVDLTKCLLPTDVQALRMSDLILLVGQLELSSLRNVVRLLHSLNNADNLGDKVRVVMNRVGSDVGEGISIQKAEEVVGRPIFWQIPNDSKAMIGARVSGEPLLKHSPRSKAQQSIIGLAAIITGKQSPEVQTTTAKSVKKGFFS